MILRRNYRDRLAACAWGAAACLLAGITCLSASRSRAATLQVVSLDLGAAEKPVSTAPFGAGMSSVVDGLKALQPEIILLQGVRDWKRCDELVKQLKPAEYHVLVCSSFRAADGASTRPAQAAIIAKQRGYFSWTERWETSGDGQLLGGFAFASLDIAGEKVACFSFSSKPRLPQGTAMQTGPGAGAYVQAAGQVLAQVKAVKNWSLNRPGLFLAGGTLGPVAKSSSPDRIQALFEAAGFGAAETESPGMDFFYSPARILDVRGTIGGAGFMVYEVHIDRAKAASITPINAPGKAPSTTNVVLNPVQPPNPVANSRKGSASEAAWHLSPLLAVGAGMFGAGIVLTALFLIRRRRPGPVPRLLAAPLNSATLLSGNYVVIAPRSSTGSTVETQTTETTPVVYQEPPTAIHTQAQPEAVPQPGSGEHLRRGLMPHFRRWLKERLIRKLIADRQQMIETQAEAEARTIDVTQRLTRIERQVQEQNRAYQMRIDELTRELNAAREESRELLRARIAQVKAEMESARARLLASAQDAPRQATPSVSEA